MMATDITMPKMGLVMTAGTVIKWLKAEGESVEDGEDICDIETEKITNQVQATARGILSDLCEEGTEVEVGAVIGKII